MGVKIVRKRQTEKKQSGEPTQWAFSRNKHETYDFLDENGWPYMHYDHQQNLIIDACVKTDFIGEFPLPKTSEWTYKVTFGK